MTVRTHVTDALDRVTDERELIEEKRSAFQQFQKRVEEMQATGPMARSSTPHATDGGMTTVTSSSRTHSETTCTEIYDAFVETIVPCCRAQTEEDGKRLVTLSDELGEEIALALAPSSDRRFTPQIKQAVLSAITARRDELGTFSAALKTEITAVRAAEDTVDQVTEWLVSANERPLSRHPFEELQQRHETLTAYEEDCRSALADRQEVLNTTTSRNGSVGVEHRSVVASLYEECPVSYPVMGTLVRLLECCRACKQTVRDHLVRRV